MIIGALVVALALSAQQPPRDPKVAPRDPKVSAGIVLDDTSAREAELVKRIAASPTGITAYQQLAKIQEDRGAVADAEATLLKAREVAPRHKPVLMTLMGFYNRQGQFDKTLAVLDEVERLDPSDSMAPVMTANFYWDKASKDNRLLPADKLRYTMSGIAATDRALALKPDSLEALSYKNVLLRMQAGLETDPFQKQQLIAEADVLRARAVELNKGRTAINGANNGVALGPPPPPPGSAPSSMAGAPVRVGGNIKTPTKTRHVPPVYPLEAQAARIQGVVIIQATIDTDGRVYDATVLRSIPLLDEAAIDAVRQWEFTPTEVNGVRVPVIMTVTVNFTLQ